MQYYATCHNDTETNDLLLTTATQTTKQERSFNFWCSTKDKEDDIAMPYAIAAKKSWMRVPFFVCFPRKGDCYKRLETIIPPRRWTAFASGIAVHSFAIQKRLWGCHHIPPPVLQ